MLAVADADPTRVKDCTEPHFARNRAGGRELSLVLQHSGSPMPRFHFHIRDARTLIPDDTGVTLGSTTDAVARAELIARALADEDLDLSGYGVEIVDGDDEFIARVPIVAVVDPLQVKQ